MAESVSITEAGKKYLQLYNMCPGQVQIEEESKCEHQLPKIQSHNSIHHQVQLRQLPFRLSQLYKNQIVKQAQVQVKEGVKCLKKELLKDLGYTNHYTNRKANQLAVKLFNKIDDEKVSMLMELSKSRNYLSRINFLHNQQQSKYQSIKRSLGKIKGKQNLE